MSKLDELFQEKLTNHSVTPSSEAWGKIENRLSKKNKSFVWFRWAAVFLLGGLLLAIPIFRQPESPVTIAETTLSSQPKKEKETGTQTSPPTAMAQEQQAIRKGTGKKQVFDRVNQVEARKPKILSEAADAKQTASIKETVTIPLKTLTEPAAVPVPIVLVYTLESVEKTIPANQESTEVASDKRDSSLKKVLNFANNVKNSDSPLENIRTAKEELFALDFKKKTNSKKH